jgi:hypothetical protein
MLSVQVSTPNEYGNSRSANIVYRDNRRTSTNKAGAAAPQDSVGGDYQLSIEDIQGGDHFPDIECTGWKRMSKLQDTSSQHSPFGPITTSSSIPTALPNLWMGPGLGDGLSVDAQCGNGTFPEVRQDWIDPMSVSLWNRVLEQAYLSGYTQQSIR